MGQMEQVLQRMHCARPSYGLVFLACGVLQKGMPLCSAHFLSSIRLWVIAMAGMGYGSERQSSGSGLGSPETPRRRSASQ